MHTLFFSEKTLLKKSFANVKYKFGNRPRFFRGLRKHSVEHPKTIKNSFDFHKLFFIHNVSVDMQVAVLTTQTKFFARKPEKFGLRAKKIVVFVSSI